VAASHLVVTAVVASVVNAPSPRHTRWQTAVVACCVTSSHTRDRRRYRVPTSQLNVAVDPRQRDHRGYLWCILVNYYPCLPDTPACRFRTTTGLLSSTRGSDERICFTRPIGRNTINRVKRMNYIRFRTARTPLSGRACVRFVTTTKWTVSVVRRWPRR